MSPVSTLTFKPTHETHHHPSSAVFRLWRSSRSAWFSFCNWTVTVLSPPFRVELRFSKSSRKAWIRIWARFADIFLLAIDVMRRGGSETLMLSIGESERVLPTPRLFPLFYLTTANSNTFFGTGTEQNQKSEERCLALCAHQNIGSYPPLSAKDRNPDPAHTDMSLASQPRRSTGSTTSS